ncbi:ATP-grasp domain-containing protein [Streptomyces sp. I05A-00742]|uniref:ATP-grasp domain-containing protein n=1 Tax=Streptomyces sp. I05A-00742 TaxID=2732853 RepID=UPI00289CD354|nr:ATP-grasp domain-containing protein [Streptomyces sp. I05A-00742]
MTETETVTETVTDTLVLPPRLTASAEAVRDAARRRGMRTEQLPGFTVPAGLRAQHLHAGPGFADAVAPVLGIAPLEAPVDWLARLPRAFTRREVLAMPLGEAHALRRPAFVKSPNDKGIRAMVYADGSRLPGPDAVDPATPVLVSDVVEFTVEHRLFVLDGAVRGGSRYGERGRLALGPLAPEAARFGAELLAAHGDTLPSAVVVDVGTVEGHWAVIEANAAWASGLYTTEPDTALDVVLRAAGPDAAVAARDRPFVRGGTGTRPADTGSRTVTE